MSSDYGLLNDPGSPNLEKTPDEIIWVTFYWAPRLDGETISTTAYELPDGLENEDTDEDGTERSILVSGGSSQSSFRIECTVTTSGGRTLQQVKRVMVREG